MKEKIIKQTRIDLDKSNYFFDGEIDQIISIFRNNLNKYIINETISKGELILKKLNDYFDNLNKNNNVSEIIKDNSITNKKQDYIDNYIYNSIVNHAIYKYEHIAYIVKNKITNCHKHYPFPLIEYKDKASNSVRNDHITPDKSIYMTVDNIELEDLIKFQEIEYELIEGYY